MSENTRAPGENCGQPASPKLRSLGARQARYKSTPALPHPTEELLLQARRPARHLRGTGWGRYAGLSSIGEELLVLRTKIRFDRACQAYPSAFRYRCEQSMLDLKKSPLKNGPKLRAQGGGKERRAEPRYPVAAMAEATDAKTHTRITGRISDIGIGGCYFEVMSPFAVGNELHVRITRNQQSVTANAKVLYSTGGMGMGLIFTSVAPEQQQVLQVWVAELSGSGVSPLTKSMPTQALHMRALRGRGLRRRRRVRSWFTSHLVRRNAPA